MAVMEILDSRSEDPQDCFYIANSIIPALQKTKYIFVVTVSKSL
jgi:hypothetical protein